MSWHRLAKKETATYVPNINEEIHNTKSKKNNKAHEPGLFVLPLQSLVVNLYEHLGMYLICLPMETVKTLVDDVDRNIKESSGLLVGSFLGCQNPLRSNLGSIEFHWVPMLLISGAPIASIRSCVHSDPHEFRSQRPLSHFSLLSSHSIMGPPVPECLAHAHVLASTSQTCL